MMEIEQKQIKPKILSIKLVLAIIALKHIEKILKTFKMHWQIFSVLNALILIEHPEMEV